MFAPTRPKSSPSKRKPFVSTTKRSSTFGTPPPLPPLTPNLKEELISDDFLEYQQDKSLAEEEIDDHLHNNFSHFQQMSIRWINMSTSLWSMIIGPSFRKIVRQSLTNFITALYWRLNGSISEEEFHWLYLEWVSRRPLAAKSQKCDIFVLRDCLLEQGTTEDDLEIFLGIIIFEANKGVINSPLSFNSPQSTMNLELCSSRWLSLGEELFFLLDSSGDGFLGFDDFFFLSICLLSSPHMGIDTDFDARISLTNVAAVAVHLMRESGAEVYFDSTWFSVSQRTREYPLEKEGTKPIFDRRHSVAYDDKGHRIQPDGKEQVDPPRENVGPEPKIPHQAGVVTLPMFKRLLIKRSVGEASLVALISFTKERTQHLVSLSEEKGVEVLYSACLHEAHAQQEIRAPKLWRTCIELIFDYSSVNELPTILLYLLTDGSFNLPLTLLAYPSGESSDQLNTAATSLGDVSEQELSRENDSILNFFASGVWNSFACWGGGYPPESSLPDPRDSVFQLISAVLLEYKSSLQLLCAAFIDIAMDSELADHTSHSSLLAAIKSLLPRPGDCALLWRELFPQRLAANDSTHQRDIVKNVIVPLELDASAVVPAPQGEDRLLSFPSEGPQPDWKPETFEEISHAIWATIFDFTIQAASRRYSTSPPKKQITSPHRTINFADRRRRRRNQKNQSPIPSFDSSNPNLSLHINTDEGVPADETGDERVPIRDQTVDMTKAKVARL
jgi:hypothetical protein